MKHAIHLTHINFPIYIGGSILPPFILSHLDNSLQPLIAFMALLTILFITTHITNYKILWLTGNYLYLKNGLRILKFNSKKTMLISSQGPAPEKFQIKITDNSKTATVTLSNYISKKQKTTTIAMIQKLCTDNKIKYEHRHI
ncbi:hypothetical protein DKY63_12935 [Pseudomonas putida]|uniref:PH domain-containing protein n=1 Tax=Pseudomonas putida TaxID=303 RepID=A0A2Z4RIH0_PSEPU|nr:hypothetical protein DKY63_12935 [Pseudomonas putida]